MNHDEMDRGAEGRKQQFHGDYTLLKRWWMSSVSLWDCYVYAPYCLTVRNHCVHMWQPSMHTQDGLPNKHHTGLLFLEWNCSIPQTPALRFQGVSVCVCLRVHVGSLFSCLCQFQSGGGRGSLHISKLSASVRRKRRRRRRPPSPAPRVKSLCVYTHDGSRPHCDVLFMLYQFIMTRPVPSVNSLPRTRSQERACLWLRRSSRQK